MRKSIVLISFFLIFSSWLFAQKPIDVISDEARQSRIDSLFNDLFFADDYYFPVADQVDNTYQLFYLRSNYDSKTFFAGREIGDNQYNISSQVYYLHSNGIFAGISGAWYSQLDPSYRTTVLTLGYSKGLKKHDYFRYRASYDYYIYNTGDVDYDPLYSSSLNVGTTLKSKTVGTRLDASFLLGKELDAQLSADFYGKIKLVKLGTYDKISLETELSFYFGSEAVQYQLSEVLIDPVTNEEYSTYYQDQFGLMNIQLEIPLNIVSKNFDIETSWVHNFPQTMDDGMVYFESSFFRFSIGYFFQL